MKHRTDTQVLFTLCDRGQIKAELQSVGGGGGDYTRWIDMFILWASAHVPQDASVPVQDHSSFCVFCAPSLIHDSMGALSLRLAHVHCPPSPCSKMNGFAAVLNHFNHLNGKRLIPASVLLCLVAISRVQIPAVPQTPAS